eukprot:g768.t1
MVNRINFLQRTEEKLLAAIRNDYRECSARAKVLQMKHKMRKDLGDAYKREEKHVSKLKAIRKHDRIVQSQKAQQLLRNKKENSRRLAEERVQNARRLQEIKNESWRRNVNCRLRVQNQRVRNRERVMHHKRKIKAKQEYERMMRDREAEQAHEQRIRESRAMEDAEEQLLERLAQLKNYRTTYRSEMIGVCDNLASKVAVMRAGQRRKKVFSKPGEDEGKDEDEDEYMDDIEAQEKDKGKDVEKRRAKEKEKEKEKEAEAEAIFKAGTEADSESERDAVPHEDDEMMVSGGDESDTYSQSSFRRPASA